MVLAESQPLTDTQIQQTLLREMAGLSCTVLDADSEPYSPMRLLHNIEKQVGYNNRCARNLELWIIITYNSAHLVRGISL